MMIRRGTLFWTAFWCMATASATVQLSGQQSVATDIPAERRLSANMILARTISVALDGVSLRRAIDELAVAGGVTVAYATDVVARASHPVTLHASRIPLGEAFARIFEGTTFQLLALPNGHFSVVLGAKEAQGTGGIAGRVTDTRTGQRLRGVTILLDGATRGVVTGDDGMFRVSAVDAGTHRVTTRLLGYSRQIRTVTVADGAVVPVDFVLEPATSTLDQVVVTGTVAATELKAVPNAMTVITAKQIEERGITKIDQLFRGDIPGLFAQNKGSNTLLDEVTMFSRGATSFGGSAGVDQNVFVTNPIKTYVDGVELADSKYLSQIDPKSIERIEILTGPQASTIYGSNAINGVMQIFTKRGTSNTPQLTLNLLSGFVQNNFSSALTPQHDYSASLNGLEGRLSYNAGGSWNYMGPWTPAKQTARTDGFGGARLELSMPAGQVTADVTFRRGITQNVSRGDVYQTPTGYRETGWYSSSNGFFGLAIPATYALTGQTLGLTLGYVPMDWWSHEFGIGQDLSDAETRYTASGYRYPSDTTLLFRQNHTDRRSLHYTTTVRMPLTAFAQASVTAGADAWQNLASALTAIPVVLTGTLTSSSYTVTRQPGHNTGGFVQTQVGLKDRLFLTYGLRVEWNPDFGANAEPSYAPRYGVAYTQDVGGVTAKLRASYGRSTRPPQPAIKNSQTVAESFGASWASVSSRLFPYYGMYNSRLANPDLTPEHQQGGEGGLEVYLGTRASLVVTRYNQTVDGLISAPNVDSVRSFVPCLAPGCAASSRDANGYGYRLQSQYVNIGSIRNQGWEFQGSVNTGPLTTRGTYSWTKSRTVGVNPKYRAQFANQAQYHPGATFQYLPEHTWALGMTYAQASSSVGFNVTGIGRATNLNDDFYDRNLASDIRLSQNNLNVSNPFGRISFNAAYALLDLEATHRFAAHVEGVFQVQNLANRYTNDFSAQAASLGRQLQLGARVRLP